MRRCSLKMRRCSVFSPSCGGGGGCVGKRPRLASPDAIRSGAYLGESTRSPDTESFKDLPICGRSIFKLFSVYYASHILGDRSGCCWTKRPATLQRKVRRWQNCIQVGSFPSSCRLPEPVGASFYSAAI